MPSVPFARRSKTSVSNRNRDRMSTTTWLRAGQVDVEQRETLGAFEAGEAGLDGQGLAEDAGRLGERHRHPLLEGCPAGERGVVIGVAELVGRGLGGIDRPGPVEQHQRSVARERHAERTPGLAIAGFGVDPLLVERTVDDAGELSAVGRERRADPVDALGPRDRGRHVGERCDVVPPRQPAVVAVQSGLDAHPAPEVGERRGDRRLHRIERRPADAVREQRRVEWSVPVTAPVDDVRLALDRVHRRRHGGRDGRPGAQLGVVGGATDVGIGGGGEPSDGRHRQVLGVGRPGTRRRW